MCGITGIFAFNLVGKFNKIHVTAATMALEKRGPDFQDIYIDEWVGLGHRRLSIIDTSSDGHQPMWDESKRFGIVFNGEIFNYRELKKELESKGISFRSQSDTEVLLKLYMLEGELCLNKLNGFFAFCIYDREEQSFFLARDRYGIKPLLYVHDEDKFIFASEMKSVLHYGIEKDIDENALFTYLQLNYIPASQTIFKKVRKVMPGTHLKLKRRQLTSTTWYTIPTQVNEHISYEDAKARLKGLMEASVQRRLVADVPLGSFLSGGIDSSVVTGIASRLKPDLQTFSIGFRDEKFFDETEYATLVSKHFNTKHHIFQLTNDDLYTHVRSVLDYIDEPFADSSAINVFILSRETRKHATVALSGDGADEMFAGYNKHEALLRLMSPGLKENVVSALSPLWKFFPQSRNNPLANLARQLDRFASGAKLPPAERYWRWASYTNEEGAARIFSETWRAKLDHPAYHQAKDLLLRHLKAQADMNDYLRTDMELVLPGDMLTKVDLMSMANGLEVRVPFLDYEIVDFVFGLPSEYKINGNMRKRILQDAYRDFLPERLYRRPKKGFEVPLLKWFRREMKPMITDDLLSEQTIREQGIFNYEEIDLLKKQLFSSNPGDATARTWALIVFQHWYKKYGR